MFNKIEVSAILIASLVAGYVINFPPTWLSWARNSGWALGIILLFCLTQKIVARNFSVGIRFKLWNVRRHWFWERSKLLFPLPAWLLYPLVLAWLSLGKVIWLAMLVFDIGERRRTGRKFAEVTEWQLSIIAMSGFITLIIASIIAQLAGQKEFALICLWFCFFNAIPISTLNGAKIFFGGKIFWMFFFTLITAMLILTYFLNIFATTIIALILAGGIAFYYAFRIEI